MTTLRSCFTGPGSPNGKDLGLVPLALCTEVEGGPWEATRAKILREAVPGCVLNLEEFKGGAKTLSEYAPTFARLIRDCSRKVGPVGMYTVRNTNRYPADPDKPLANFDSDVAVAKVLRPVLTILDSDGYFAYAIGKTSEEQQRLFHEWRKSIVNHRQITRLLYPGLPFRWWTMCLTLDGSVIPQGTLEGMARMFKVLADAGDEVVLFKGMEPWDSVDDNFVATAKRIIGA